MPDVTAELEIAVEPIVVFAALIDLDRLPQWLSVAVEKIAVPTVRCTSPTASR